MFNEPVTIQLDEQTVTLRLTTRNLRNYCNKHGEKGTRPLVAVLSALDDINARADLLTAALNHPGNHNPIKSGDDLLDALAARRITQKAVDQKILELAVDAGLVDDEDVPDLSIAVADSTTHFVDVLSRVLSGKPSRKTETQTETAPPAEDAGETAAENPT